MLNKVCLIVLALASVIYAQGQGQGPQGNGNGNVKADPPAQPPAQALEEVPEWAPPNRPKCPEGWIAYNRKCYIVNETPLTQLAANNACSGFDPNAKLLVIDDQDEFNFWLNKIKSENLGFYVESGVSVNYVWIGAIRNAGSGDFQWNTGGILAENDPNWDSAYPQTGTFTCASLFTNGGLTTMKYRNKSCNINSFVSICEKGELVI